MTDSPQAGVPPREGVTILTTCAHHGARGFCNLRGRRDGGEITLDPHVYGGCVINLLSATPHADVASLTMATNCG